MYRLHHELVHIQAEVTNGMIRPTSYILVNTCVTLISLVSLPLCVLCIPMFLIQSFDTSQMFPILIHWSLLFFVFESLAEALAIWMSSLVGSVVYLIYWVVSFLFAGTFIRSEDMFWPFKLFSYITPFGYYVRNMAHFVLLKSSFKPCDPTTSLQAQICVPSGSGRDVMKQLEETLPLLKGGNLSHDAMVLVAMIFLFKCVFNGGLLWKVTRHSLPTHHDSGEKKMNWMKTVSINQSVFVEASSATEVQLIVKQEDMFPSPIRPAGRILSPSSIHSNEGGTTISTVSLNTIYGVRKVQVSHNGRLTTVSCIDCEPGVTLRELQLAAHKNDLEIPFSAEIGSATVGGTCFAVTKDSSIGEHPLKGLGLGDMASLLWSVQVVEDDGEIHEHCLFNRNGTLNHHFQKLLDSYGSTCIAVRMMIMARPKTPLTTILDVSHFHWRNTEICKTKARQLYRDWQEISSKNGNIFCSISLVSDTILLERRLIGRDLFAPLSAILSRIYTLLKRNVIQSGSDFPFLAKLLGKKLFRNSIFTRFYQQSRSPGNLYDLDIPINTPKLSFTNVAFSIEKFPKVMTGILRFTREYEISHNYKPNMFAIYFVKLSGRRVAGPYSLESTHAFFFDPTTNNPNDEKFMKYLVEFNNYAKSLGGKPSLNQTLCLESDPEFAATALSMRPSKRFESEWLKQFSPFVKEDCCEC